MKHGIICTSKRVLGYFAWPTVARIPDGKLMVVASGFRMKHVCPFGKVIACYSEDEGESWTAPSVIIDTPLDDRGGGVVVCGNNVYVTEFTNSIAEQKEWAENDTNISEQQKNFIESYIAQITPEEEKKYLGSFYAVSKDGGYSFGEPEKIYVSAPHGMTKLNDGSLYYVGNKFPYSVERPNEIYYVRSKDGINFSKPTKIDIPEKFALAGLSFAEPYAICLKSGKILLYFREDNSFSIYSCTSKDNGNTFDEPKYLFYGSPPHLLEHSSGALILSYGYREPPYGQRVRISYDEGETWGEEIILRNDGISLDLGYPSSIELKDGSILTVYYQILDKNNKNASICYTKWRLPEK